MKIDNVWGDLTNISVKTKPLLYTCLLLVYLLAPIGWNLGQYTGFRLNGTNNRCVYPTRTILTSLVDSP